MPQNIGENRVNPEGIARITPEDAQRLSRYLVREGDIIYSRRGDVERRALIRQQEDGWLCGTGCLRVRPGVGRLESTYLSYYLAHPATRSWIVRHAIGATMPNLNTGTLSALPVVVPSLDEQREIASMLNALDDKIHLNRRTDEALEALARALFKSWFEDFDPVRARASGEEPWGMDAATAALFPNEFEASELGEIPRGWRVAPIGDVTRVVGGSTPRTAEESFWNGDVCFATPKDLSRLEHPALLDTERHITQDGLAQISSGLLPPGTVLLSSRAPIGYLAIAEVPVSVNQGFIAMVCDRDLPNHFVLRWCAANMEGIKARANGTTFLEVSKAGFRPIPCVVPSGEVLGWYVEQVEPLYRRLVANIRESQTLTTLRDALLPKLLSGEVRVAPEPQVN